MSSWHYACSSCPLSHDCLLRDDNSVEECEDVQEAKARQRASRQYSKEDDEDEDYSE